jgi:ligand-binding sensor domain-containing protein
MTAFLPRCFGLALLSVLLPGHLAATKLASHVFTTADGLGRDNVSCIVPDSKGFIWLCTSEGISRYDGYQFVSYGVQQGLAHRAANAVLETRTGIYLVATDLGISRLDVSKPPTSAQRFVSIPRSDGLPVSRVYALYEDRAGVVWCATPGGLYRVEDLDRTRPTLRFVSLGLGPEGAATSLIEDQYGSLWAGTSLGVCRRWPDGRVEWHNGPSSKLPREVVNALIIDRHGYLWVGTLSGLWKIQIGAAGNTATLLHRYDARDGLVSVRVHSLLESRTTGHIWVGSSSALSELTVDEKGREHFHTYGADEGLSGRAVFALAEDNQGALWAGVDHGLSRIARDGFATFTEKEGIGRQSIIEVRETGPDLWAASNQGGSGIFLHHLVNEQFVSTRPRYPASMKYFGWGTSQIALRDHEGEWWIATGEGLCRFPRVAAMEQLAVTPPRKVYTQKDGLPQNEIFRLFEDSRGDIWITTTGTKAHSRLARWDRRSNEIHSYTTSDCPGMATAFAEDQSGNLWIGFSNEIFTHRPSGLLRYRNGTFEQVSDGSGGAIGWILALYLDRAGDLLVGSTDGGLGRVEHPTAADPRIIVFAATPSISSNSVRCISEDRTGHIYIGTPRGVDRIEPQTRRVRHYTTGDGLAGGWPSSIECDRSGRIWVGTSLGLSLLVPTADRPPAPRIFITSLTVNGEPRGVAEPGIEQMSGLELQPDQTRFHLDFVGVGGASGEPLQYQYMLEGVDQTWSAPTIERGVSYGGLRPGRFRFLVRTAAAGTLASSAPAEVAFEVLAPVWKRWWFLSSAIAILCGLALFAHQYDLSRRLEPERVRLRIATDLHDDLGASLTRMTILTELVSRQAERLNPGSGHDIGRIAEMARGMVDALGDLVWSVDPRRDDMASTVRRIRRYATDVLETQGIRWTFESPAHTQFPSLGPEQRRHLLLIFQEALRNAARHAHCSAVDLVLTLERRECVARIRDNGRGLPDPIPDSGAGIRNLRARAAALGGVLSIVSAPDAGTDLTVRFVPAAARTGWRRIVMLFLHGWGMRSNQR